MRRWIPYFILAVLTAIASRPFWSTANYLSSYDGLLHLYRTFALDATLHQGLVYPRWLLDLAYGYGYPILNYYPPLAGYIAETSHILGLGFADALKVTFVAIIAVAVLGAYAMGKEFLGRGEHAASAGLLTAVAYVFFPYFMVDVYTRGALAEALAAAILPWLFWALRRTLVNRTASAFLVTALLVTVLILAHSLTAVIIAPLLMAYALFESRRLPAQHRIPSLLRVLAASVLGLGLCAFYWLPFVVELPLVQMGRGVDVIAEIFQTNFLQLPALVQPSLFYTYGGPPVPLGLTAMVLAALTLILALLAGTELKERATIIFFVVAALVGSLAIAEPARAIWTAFPLSTMLQSVWRVSILIGLSVSVVIGSLPPALAASDVIRRVYARMPAYILNLPVDLVRQLLVVFVALILILTTTVNLAPEQVYLPPGELNLARLARFEVFTQSLGTTTFGEYAPATVEATDLINYHAPIPASPASARPAIRLLQRTATQWTLSVSTSESIPIYLRAFYFPDWQATLDGIPTRLYSSTPLGLLTVDVPPGDHLLVLHQNETPSRRIGTVISWIAAFIAFVLLAAAIRRHETALWNPVLTAAFTLTVIVVPTAVAMTADPSAIHPLQAGVSPGLDLIGLSIDGAQSNPAGVWQVPDISSSLHVRAYWQVRQSGLQDLPISWRLVDAQGHVWVQRAQLPRYGTALESTWMPNEVVEDQYDLPLVETPRGLYTLQVAFGLDGEYITCGQITLTKTSPPMADQPAIPSPLDAIYGNQIRLLGYAAPPVAKPGEKYPLTLFWQAQQDLFEDLVVSAQLLNADGRLVAQHDSPPLDGLSPTSLWLPHQTVSDRREIEIPQGLAPGEYSMIVVLYHSQDLKRLPAVTAAGPSTNDAVELEKIRVSPAAIPP